MSSTKIDNCLWTIEKHLAGKYGFKVAYRDMVPLRWYIGTGRASVNFLHKLFDAKPFMVARRLHKHSGCEADAIRSIKKLIGYVDAI